MSDKPLRILVVDDELGLRRGCQLTLESEGYEVVTAKDGQEGLEKFGTRSWDGLGPLAPTGALGWDLSDVAETNSCDWSPPTRKLKEPSFLVRACGSIRPLQISSILTGSGGGEPS